MESQGAMVSFLLGLPSELVGQILGYRNISHMVISLWKTGSNAMRSRLIQSVTSLSLQADEMPTKPEVLLPACLVSLISLRHLDIYIPDKAIINHHHMVKTLQHLNPGLETLHLNCRGESEYFRPQLAREQVIARQKVSYNMPMPIGAMLPASGGDSDSEEDDYDDYHDFDSDSRSDSEDDDSGCDSDRSSHSGPEKGEIIEKSIDFGHIDLSLTFPKLETLFLNQLMDYAEATDIAFPESLTSLTLPPPSSKLLVAWASALPRSLMSLCILFPVEQAGKQFFDTLPSSITELIVSTRSENCMHIPSSITQYSSYIDSWNPEIAANFPAKKIADLNIHSLLTTYDWRALPSTLTKLYVGCRFSAEKLRLLPRQLTDLSCEFFTDTVAPNDFPPHLKNMKLKTSNYNELRTAPAAAVIAFSSALPRSMTSLNSLAIAPKYAQFYAQLPPSLTTLTFGDIYDIESDGFSLPPNLQTIAFGAYSRYEEEEGMDTCLEDRDAWTLEDSLAASSGTIPSMDPEYVMRPFPYHMLPKSLTSFTNTTRPTPISALRFLPLLNQLTLKKLVLDAKYDPHDQDLIAKANNMRQFGELARRRVTIASEPLTQVRDVLDLLPRSLVNLSINSSENIPKISIQQWMERFPSLDVRNMKKI